MNRPFPTDHTPQTFDQGVPLGVSANPDMFAGQRLTISATSGIISGPAGYGKTRTAHVITAGLAHTTDTVTWLIDTNSLDIGDWAYPYLTGAAPAPAVDWIATHLEDALTMLRTANAEITRRIDFGRAPTAPNIVIVVHAYPRSTHLAPRDEGLAIFDRIVRHGADVGVHLLYVATGTREDHLPHAVSRPGLDITLGARSIPPSTRPAQGRAVVRFYPPDWAEPRRRRREPTPFVEAVVDVYELTNPHIHDLAPATAGLHPTLTMEHDHADTYASRWNTPSINELRHLIGA